MPKAKTKSAPRKKENPILFECAWEVCNQVGGIYTVIRSKTPSMVARYDTNYILIGPYLNDDIQPELDYTAVPKDNISNVVKRLKKKGWNIQEAIWLITGRPRVILFDFKSVENDLDKIKNQLRLKHKLEIPPGNMLVDQAISFGFMVKSFLASLSKTKSCPPLIAHFHEWQAGVPLLYLKNEKINVKTVFTTHATILGRYLAYNSPHFYDHLPFFDAKKEARHFNIMTEFGIEYLSARFADRFTTVSKVTARECKYLLGKKTDKVLPNGINIKRFVAFHEFQNLHARFKDDIHRFVMGHFFQSYPFELENTVYFFTSGRFEYRNKGFDMALQALDILNKKMKKDRSDTTVVFFIITRKKHQGIKSDVLESRALMEEIRKNCDNILDQVGKKLFYAGTTREDNRLPNLNEFVDDYWKLRYRRTIQTWKTRRNPSVITHNLENPQDDEVLNGLKQTSLDNGPDQKVKIVYHPEFISTTSPLFGIEYGDFVRGCHLGIFPSYYEPWGYTPLECMARGVPSITSDLSGFGDFINSNVEDPQEKGIFVVERRKKTPEYSVNQLADVMYDFIQQDRRQRIMQRNNTENTSVMFDWNNLVKYYDQVYKSFRF